jgi:hypothetical protein
VNAEVGRHPLGGEELGPVRGRTGAQGPGVRRCTANALPPPRELVGGIECVVGPGSIRYDEGASVRPRLKV